jgi:DNA-binding MarR family transcriptional regulator
MVEIMQPGASPVNELIGLLQQIAEGLARLNHTMATASRSHPTDMTALSVLARAGSPLTVGELAERLKLSAGAATSLVDRLEQAGHVQRVRDSGDRRRWHLQITDTADQLARGVLNDFVHHTRTRLAGYTPDEMATARRLLADVRDALAATTPSAEPSSIAHRHRPGEDGSNGGEGHPSAAS